LEGALNRIRSIADYQFGKGVGVRLFPENVNIQYSQKTGRIRYVYLNGKRLVTLRPTDGMFSLSISGAKRIIENDASAKCLITVKDEVSDFIMKGGDVFAAHIISVDDEIRPKSEVIVMNKHRKVLAVGRAILSGEEMKTFKKGVAVKVRRGCLQES